MIDKNYGEDRGELTDETILLVREVAHISKGTEKEILAMLAEEFLLPEEAIEKILDGKIAPYIGGPLRPLLLQERGAGKPKRLVGQGCNPRFAETTRNRQRFVRGILTEARFLLSEEEFVIFCNFNGMKVDEAEKYMGSQGDIRDRYDREKFGNILEQHAHGKTIEEAVSNYKKRQQRANS